jgi:beta-glucanase (GH16 family)
MRMFSRWRISTPTAACSHRRGLRHARRAILAVGCMAFLASCSVGDLTTVPNPTAVKLKDAAGATWTPGANWVMTWNSDFSRSGSLRDWTIISGGGGWGNKQLQGYSPKNISLVPGVGLVLTASRDGNGQVCWYGQCSYSSGRLQTNGLFQQKYGIFSARIKLPTGRGLWPAFWMEGSDSTDLAWPAAGEIDVIEVNNQKPDLVEAFAHAPEVSKGFYLSLKASLSAGYHVYSVEWTPKEITWLVDGHEFGHMANASGSPFHQPFYLILDLAVGGDWPGSPTSATKFPAQMDVAWVRAYEQKTTPISPGISG